MIVVLDTNIWISALQFGKNYGSPVRALERAMQQDVIAIADELETEILTILVRKFDWPPSKAQETMHLLLAHSRRYTLQHTVHVCRDPKDDMFLECAQLASADALIAGDKDLLVLGSHAGTRIITPLEYITLES